MGHEPLLDMGMLDDMVAGLGRQRRHKVGNVWPNQSYSKGDGGCTRILQAGRVSKIWTDMANHEHHT